MLWHARNSKRPGKTGPLASSESVLPALTARRGTLAEIAEEIAVR
jgi:hypothetical protein